MKLADYLSQEQIRPADFAKRIGTPASTITRFLAGKRGIGLGIALRIEQFTAGTVRPQDLDASTQPAPQAEAAA